MSERVLVVDDERDWIETYRDWLEPEGYEVRGAGGIDEALEQALDWEPHAILVDQKLEVRGGRELGLSLIRRLTDQSPACQVLLVTAFATKAAVVEAFANGAADYLEKGQILEPLLKRKVAMAVGLGVRAQGDLRAEIRERVLREDWEQAQTDTKLS